MTGMTVTSAGFPGVRVLMDRARAFLLRPERRLRLMLAVLTAVVLTLGPLLMLDCLLFLPAFFEEPLSSVLYGVHIALQAALLLLVGLPISASVYRMTVTEITRETDDPAGDVPPYAGGWAAVGDAVRACLWCFSSLRAYRDCLLVSAGWLLWLIEVLLCPIGCVLVFIFKAWDGLLLPDAVRVLLYILTVLVTLGLTFLVLLLSGSPAAFGCVAFDPTGSARCPFLRVLWARAGTRRVQLLLRLRMTGWYLVSAALVLVPLLLIAFPCGLTVAACFGKAVSCPTSEVAQ